MGTILSPYTSWNVSEEEPEGLGVLLKCSLEANVAEFCLPSPSSCRTHESLFECLHLLPGLGGGLSLFQEEIRRHPTRDVLICSWLLRCAWNRVLVFSSPSPPHSHRLLSFSSSFFCPLLLLFSFPSPFSFLVLMC